MKLAVLALLSGVLLASSGVLTAQQADRIIHFSDLDWTVKGGMMLGPGPNNFGDGEDNVWVDATGRLHLRIHYARGRWWCAEIVSVRSLGYGTHRFTIETDPASLDANVILGLFTWDADTNDPRHREIDIEFGRWGEPDNLNAQFVVQPPVDPNVHRFDVPRKLGTLRCDFEWVPSRVAFDCATRRAPRRPIARRTFVRGIPDVGRAQIRMNLWLLAGRPPSDGRDVEVIVSSFSFVPHHSKRASSRTSLPN